MYNVDAVKEAAFEFSKTFFKWYEVEAQAEASAEKPKE
jgi:hypothetical protein